MIIDCVMFNDEFDMLRARLDYLRPMVGLTVISEADITHSGKSKPLHFQERRAEFAQYNIQSLVCHYTGNYDFDRHPATIDPTHPSWLMEFGQRNKAIEVIRDQKPEDIVLVGDLDEIPSLDTLAVLPAVMTTKTVVSMPMIEFWYNSCWVEHVDIRTVAARQGFFDRLTPGYFREMRRRFPTVNNTGWHLSWFMDAERIQQKLTAYAHQEQDRQRANNLEHIRHCMANGLQLFTGKQLQRANVTIPEQFRRLS